MLFGIVLLICTKSFKERKQATEFIYDSIFTNFDIELVSSCALLFSTCSTVHGMIHRKFILQ